MGCSEDAASLLQKVSLELLREQLVSLAVWSLTLLQKLGSCFLAVFPPIRGAENSQNLISYQNKANALMVSVCLCPLSPNDF